MFVSSVEIKNKAILAPLAGISDMPFRRICRELGAGAVFSEMVSADGIFQNSVKTWRFLDFEPVERPLGFQLFGQKPDVMARAVELINPLKPDMLDINFGCPAPKVVRRGAGSALLKDLDLLESVFRAMRENTDIPVWAKIRSGWDTESIVAIEVAQRLEAAGAAAVTLHPRTRAQRFQGHSDWSMIQKVKETVKIPVIGNGDIKCAADAKRMYAETGCDLVMVGRAAFGNPWIFREIEALLEHGEEIPRPRMAERMAVCMRQIDLSEQIYSERYALFNTRTHIAWYTRGMPESTNFRNHLFRTKSVAQMRQMLNEYTDFVTQHENEALAEQTHE
ncbi:tRNA dihydrouridine synthase DusB [bacterium]|nr:tRNA dihydrouridine synthase DusB [bacterium]